MDRQLRMKKDSYMKYDGEMKETCDNGLNTSLNNGCIEVSITELDNIIAEKDTQITLVGKENEAHFNSDGVALSNRFKIGKYGEMAVEEVLGIRFSDIGEQGNSYKYNNPDLLEAGYNLGCKCAKKGNGLLIPKKCKEDQIVVIYDEKLRKSYILGILKLEDIHKYWSKSYVQPVNAYNDGVKLGFINYEVIKPAKSIEHFREMVQEYKVGPQYNFLPGMSKGVIDILNNGKVAFIRVQKNSLNDDIYIHSINNSSTQGITNVESVPFNLDYLSQFDIVVGGDSYINQELLSIDRALIITQNSDIEKYKSDAKEIILLDIDKEMKKVVNRLIGKNNLGTLSSTETDMLTSKSIQVNKNFIDLNNYFISNILLTLVAKCEFVSKNVL